MLASRAFFLAEAIAEQVIETPGDAANQNADAAEIKEVDAAEADVDSFLTAGKEGAAEGTEAKGDDEVDILLQEARDAATKAASEKAEREANARLAREEQERKTREDSLRAEQEHEKGYRDRMARQLGLAAELRAEGIDSDTAERLARRVADDFNAHHADGLKRYLPEAEQRVQTTYTQLLNEAIKSDLGSDEAKFFGTQESPKSYNDFAGALKSYREIVTDGLITKSEADAEKKLALVKYRRELEHKGLIQGASSGQTVNGNGMGASGPSSLAEAELMHAGMHPSGKTLTNAEMVAWRLSHGLKAR